ncbi:unnamed protein product [Euphydryas editha]|uniref:Regulatory protein zeste n=1 Tax=Euphydryas editha TaxID=104508 RepID=A0AAU9VB74_EUPED|nr:unnamed protein product [Euphydryas editha]
MEPRQRASPEQFSLLIDFMERHGDLSRPQSGPQGRIKGDRLWQQLASILNSLGGGVVKSSDKWKKVWADWKTKTKKKYLNIKRQSSRTGGGPTNRVVLTALEERVVAVIGVSAVVGQAGIQEQGFHLENALEDPMEPPKMVLEDHNSQNIAIPTPAWPAVITIPQLEENAPTLMSSLPLRLPLPHSPLEQNSGRRQASASPCSTSTTPHRASSGAQKNRGTTPLERAADLLEEDAPAPSPSLSPQLPPPPLPLPHSPPAQNSRRRQASASPCSSFTTPRRVSRASRARRNRGMTPFERAADLFAKTEERRLVHEEERDKRLHVREMERLRLEAERIGVTRQQNDLLHQLSLLGQRLIDVITQQPRSS